mgnify:CR=1 FL=1
MNWLKSLFGKKQEEEEPQGMTPEEVFDENAPDQVMPESAPKEGEQGSEGASSEEIEEVLEEPKFDSDKPYNE